MVSFRPQLRMFFFSIVSSIANSPTGFAWKWDTVIHDNPKLHSSSSSSLSGCPKLRDHGSRHIQTVSTQNFPSRHAPGTRLKFCWRPAATTKMSYSSDETRERRRKMDDLDMLTKRESCSCMIEHIQEFWVNNLHYKCRFYTHEQSWDVCN